MKPLDLQNSDGRLVLPVAACPPLTRLVLVTEDVDLRALGVPDDLGRDVRPLERGRTGLYGLAVGDEQDLIKRDLVAGVAGDLSHGDLCTLFDAVLLPAASDDCVHEMKTFRTEKVAPLPAWRINSIEE